MGIVTFDQIIPSERDTAVYRDCSNYIIAKLQVS